MHLTPELIPAFVDFLNHERSEAERAERRAALLESISLGRRDPTLTRLLLDPDHRIRAALVTLPIGENVHQLFQLIFAPNTPERQKPEALPLLVELLEVARSRSLRGFECRLEARHLFPGYEQALLELGFTRVGERIEFKGPLSALPDELGSPLSWEPVSDNKLAAELLGRVGPGAPDWQADDDPAQLMIDYFSDPSLTRGPDCVHIGCSMGTPRRWLSLRSHARMAGRASRIWACCLNYVAADSVAGCTVMALR